MPRKTEKKFQTAVIFRLLFWETLFFLLIFVLGLLSAAKLGQFFIEEEIIPPSISLENFIFYFVSATLIILLIIYLPKIKKIKGALYKFFFIFSALYGSLAVLSLFLPDIATLLIIAVLIFCWYKHSNILIHNLLMVLGLSGIGSIIGLAFKPEAAIILLAVLSVYDFIAVYKTKHMIKMAKSMIESGVIMGIIVPQKAADFWQKTKEAQMPGKFVVLGGGDIVFPLILAVSLIPQSILEALIVAFFALLGAILSFLIFIFQKKREPIPALPPIALLSIIGYLVTLLI